MPDEEGISPDPPAGAELLSFRWPARAEEVRAGLCQVMGSRLLQSLARADRHRAELLLAEVLNNIVRHAYRDCEGDIRLHLQLSGGSLRCVIEDDGHAMPECRLPEGMPPDPADLPEGGFGWFLIRSLASVLHYQREAQTNRLDITMICEH